VGIGPRGGGRRQAGAGRRQEAGAEDEGRRVGRDWTWETRTLQIFWLLGGVIWLGIREFLKEKHEGCDGHSTFDGCGRIRAQRIPQPEGRHTCH
jgi:hypothetical protein